MLKNNSSPLFLFNGEPLPSNPSVGYLEKSEQITDSTRNANAQVIAQPINRRLKKFDNLVFPILPLEDYEWLEDNVATFEVLLTYYDTHERDVIIRRFYFGDMSGTPSKWDKSYTPVQKPLEYRDVKVNIIDMGY